MSLIERLKDMFQSGEEREAHDLQQQVRLFYTDAMHREQQLLKQAEMAPHAAGRDGLRLLAVEEKDVVARLRQIIQGLGSFAGEVRSTPDPIGALNYWARLVQNLEAHREAVRALLDESALVTDAHPELADELRQLARLEDAHCAMLRALIAKSDPQALN